MVGRDFQDYFIEAGDDYIKDANGRSRVDN